MSSDLLDVLVVGAGPVGLFCANELARQGLRCRIVDKKSELSDKSKALALHSRSLDLFEDCGFLDEILSQGLKVEGIIIKSRDKELIDANFTLLKANHRYLIDLPQDKTEGILHKGLMQKGLRVEWNTELIGIEQRSSNTIATLKQEDGQVETLHVSWLIACDGSHSTLRKLLYVEFLGANYNQTWWLADLVIDWALPETKMVAYMSDEGPLACFPMGHKRYRLITLAPYKIDDDKEPTLADIEQVFRRRCPDKADLSEPIWINQFGITHRQIKKYRYERVFFTGDAAHVHSPMGGQGLNTGLQDIYNLAWKLALVQKGFAKEKLLDSYHLERFPIAKKVLQKTGLMTQITTLSNPLLIGLRNYFLHFLIALNPVKNFILRDLAELDLSYAKSPLTAALGKKTGFKIGEFVTDFSLSDAQSNEKKLLRQITQGTSHHLFLFSGLNNSELSSLRDTAITIETRYHGLIKTHLVLAETSNLNPAPHSLWLDTNQEVHKGFAIQEATALLFRPDKYLSLTQTPINQQELLHHLEKGYINKAKVDSTDRLS